MTLIDKAVAIVQQRPLPDDAEAQLDALYQQAEGIEADEIQTLFEALLWRRDIDAEKEE